MSAQYGCLAFTDDVRRTQEEYGSAEFYTRIAERGRDVSGYDRLGSREAQFLGALDGFYLATVSETQWPYVQFRGGPPGFVRVLDPHTIAWADYRGNLQHVSGGNLRGNDRAAMIGVDYATRRRLKLFGHARVARAEDDDELIHTLAASAEPGATVEAAIVVTVVAFDWNCPQHIPRRFTADQVGARELQLRHRIAELEAENAALRARRDTVAGADADRTPAEGVPIGPRTHVSGHPESL